MFVESISVSTQTDENNFDKRASREYEIEQPLTIYHLKITAEQYSADSCVSPQAFCLDHVDL